MFSARCGAKINILNTALKVIINFTKSFLTRNIVQKQAPEVFCLKRCSQKFDKIHRKTPVGLFLTKVAGLRPATLLKKRLWHRCFPVNFVKLLRTPFLQNTPGRLLLAVSPHQANIWQELFKSPRHSIFSDPRLFKRWDWELSPQRKEGADTVRLTMF